MSTNLRVGNLLGILFVGCGLVACTTQAANPTGTGGSGAGTSGTGTGGGGGGTTGSGTAGAGGNTYATSAGVPCLAPQASGLITDFTYAPGDAAAPTMDQVHFGDDATNLSGGEFIYPNASSTSAYVLVSDVTGSNWHIHGTVGDYSGFGFYLEAPIAGVTTACTHVDASAFKGISFTISGTVQGSSLTFEVDTLKDTIAPSWLNAHAGTALATDPGECVPGPTVTSQYNQSDCTEPTKAITVGATAATVTVLWSDFTTGKPEAAVVPSDIVGIRWVLPTPAGVTTASVVTYPLDITVDNITFIPN